MSVIIVKKEKDKIIVGADSQDTTSQTQKENIQNLKLKKIEDGVYIAGAGDAHLCSLLYAYAEKNSMQEITTSWSLIEYFTGFKDWVSESIYNDSEDNKDHLQRAQFFVIINNKVWQFANFYIREIEEDGVGAIGCGAQSGLACMTLTDSIEEALNAVCKTDIYCSTPLDIVEIKIDGHV